MASLTALDIFLLVTSVLALLLARFVNRLTEELKAKRRGENVKASKDPAQGRP